MSTPREQTLGALNAALDAFLRGETWPDDADALRTLAQRGDAMSS